MPTYTDLDPSLSMNPLTGDISRLVDAQAIISSCRNLVLGNTNSRPFQPDLGSGLEFELFEPLNPITANNISRRITTVIRNNEPRISNLQVIVNTNAQDDGYNITVILQPKNSLQQVTFTVFLSRII